MTQRFRPFVPKDDAAREYATITRETHMIAARHHDAPGGLESTVYRIARAALLLLPNRRRAAEMAYSLADEMAISEHRP